mmetsp:Transcript_36910/g.80399  ORF Transcript_36910/g.80399 Transcript_36910/m.80399 type:complete len:252 (+) Transcript_36910:922-1677(+)
MVRVSAKGASSSELPLPLGVRDAAGGASAREPSTKEPSTKEPPLLRAESDCPVMNSCLQRSSSAYVSYFQASDFRFCSSSDMNFRISPNSSICASCWACSSLSIFWVSNISSSSALRVSRSSFSSSAVRGSDVCITSASDICPQSSSQPDGAVLLLALLAFDVCSHSGTWRDSTEDATQWSSRVCRGAPRAFGRMRSQRPVVARSSYAVTSGSTGSTRRVLESGQPAFPMPHTDGLRTIPITRGTCGLAHN